MQSEHSGFAKSFTFSRRFPFPSSTWNGIGRSDTRSSEAIYILNQDGTSKVQGSSSATAN